MIRGDLPWSCPLPAAGMDRHRSGSHSSGDGSQ